MATTVYTDGACIGNPGPGGWAWAVPDGAFASGAASHTTNQRMEITAALEAVRALPGPLEIVSDSTYVVNCWRDRWWESWVANGWRNKAKKPVASRDLWEPLVAVFAEGRVTMRWVKGHGADPVNDLVDRLAVEAARTQRGRAGSRPPTDVGPADVAPAGTSSGGSELAFPELLLPEGRRLVVAGHRPPALGGYEPNAVADDLRRRLTEVLAAKHQMHPDLVVLTGLGLGAEQLGAEACLIAGIPYVAVLPYPDPGALWPDSGKVRLAELRSAAAAEVVLQHRRPKSRQQAGAALSRRDDWLGRHAHEAVVVWDGVDGAVGRVVRSLRDRLGEDEVWVLAPTAAAEGR